MKNTASPNLLTGNGFTAVLRFSIPMMIGAIVEQLYSSADSIIAGNFIGSNALAAIGATATVIFFVFSLNSGLANGSCIIIAQAYGEGEESKIRRAIVGACYYTVGCIMIISSLGILFIRPLLELLQTPADIIEDSTAYLGTGNPGASGTMPWVGSCAVHRANSSTTAPLIPFGTSVMYMNRYVSIGGKSYGTFVVNDTGDPNFKRSLYWTDLYFGSNTQANKQAALNYGLHSDITLYWLR